MIYLLHGTESYPLFQKKSQLIQQSKVSEDNLTSFDGEDSKFHLSQAITSCSTTSLFQEQRFVIVHRPKCFRKIAKGSKTSNRGDEIDLLESYLQHPNPECHLLFYIDGEEVDQRGRAYKMIKPFIDHGVVQEFVSNPIKPWEMPDTLVRAFQKAHLQITQEAKEELLFRLNGSLSMLYQAIEKLQVYQENPITLQTIEHLIPQNTDQLVWKICNALIADQKDQILRYYQVFQEETQGNTILLISSLATSLRRMYISILCYERGMMDDEITRSYGIKYPQTDRRHASGQSSQVFLSYLYKLATIEQGIKNGTIQDTDQAIQMFLLAGETAYARA